MTVFGITASLRAPGTVPRDQFNGSFQSVVWSPPVQVFSTAETCSKRSLLWKLATSPVGSGWLVKVLPPVNEPNVIGTKESPTWSV